MWHKSCSKGTRRHTEPENVFAHLAGRVYREALQFSVSGQPSAVMENSLGQLLWLEELKDWKGTGVVNFTICIRD